MEIQAITADTRGNAQRIAYAGIGILAAGTLMPLISIPVTGQVSAIQLGFGYIYIVLAAISAFLAHRGRLRGLWITGGLTAAHLVIVMMDFQNTAARSGGLFGAVTRPRMELGFWVLALGVGITLYAASQRRSPTRIP